LSAILKALRRVENESVQRSETLPVSKKLDARKAIRNQYTKKWTTRKLLTVLLPLLTVPIVIWVVFSYKPSLLSNSSTAVLKSNASPANPSPERKEPTSEDSRKRSEDGSPGASLSNEARAPSRAAPNKEKKAAPDAPLAQKEGVPVQGPEFKLQAIVWSEVAESRFAVINGVIVRAGGMIEGVSVTDIEKDYVSFKSGQRTWKMRMMAD
jgi:Type II secretion system protein B